MSCGELLLALLLVSPATAGTDRAECITDRSERYGIERRLSAEVFRAAERHGVPPDLFYAVVSAESSFRPGVVSRMGAVGLAQVKPSTAAELRPGLERWELFAPRVNLDVGAKYLRRLLDRYGGNRASALAAYNVGPARLARASETGEPNGGRYVRRVLASMD